uniref:Uncharacterized protein n=1 Tax=Pundamilia nyererei TaxID=303518 RepID=A0A3B4GGM2_9CICH
LDQQCNELMRTKFGRLVDLEALQMLSGNRRLEELKQEKLLKEAAYAKEIRQWDVYLYKIYKIFVAIMCYFAHILYNLYMCECIQGRQQFQDYRRRTDQEAIQNLQDLVIKQSQQAEALRREIHLLSCKGGHMLPPDQTRLPPLSPLRTPIGSINTGK